MLTRLRKFQDSIEIFEIKNNISKIGIIELNAIGIKILVKYCQILILLNLQAAGKIMKTLKKTFGTKVPMATPITPKSKIKTILSTIFITPSAVPTTARNLCDPVISRTLADPLRKIIRKYIDVFIR